MSDVPSIPFDSLYKRGLTKILYSFLFKVLFQ